jgi:hypothetical protein
MELFELTVLYGLVVTIRTTRLSTEALHFTHKSHICEFNKIIQTRCQYFVKPH